MTRVTRDAMGRAIAAARAEAGLTQEALGRRTNLGQTVVSRIENGARRVDFIELVSIASALELDVTVLLDRGSAAPHLQGPDYTVIGLRLDEEHPGHAEALRPALRLLERVVYLQERVGPLDSDDCHWRRR